MTVPASQIGFTGAQPFRPNVSVYKIANRFLSCRASKFVEDKTMKRFGWTNGEHPKVLEHAARYGKDGSPKAQRVLAIFNKYNLEQLLALTPEEVGKQLPKTHFERLVGVSIVGANWAEHYGYAQVAESVAMAHYDSSCVAAPAKDVLTPEQLSEAAIYGLTDQEELVWFRSCRDHGMDFKEDGTLYNFDFKF